MTINAISQYNNKIFNLMAVKQLDFRHEELCLEAVRVKEQLEENEQKRIEMNRRMNRPGQNVDKLA